MPARSLEADPAVARAQALALRCPLLAFDELQRWASPGWRISTDDPTFEAAFEESRSVLRRRLREALKRPEVREGLFLVSADFFQAVKRWGSAFDQDQAAAVEGALAEQLVRLATRAEFTSFEVAPALGEIGRGSRLPVGALSGRHTQIDIRYLSETARSAASLPPVKAALRFFASSSLYRIEGKVRYAKCEASGEYRSVAAELNPRLDAILRRAEAGASFEELIAEAVGADPRLSRENAASYVDELIAEQLLDSDLGTGLTAGDAPGELTERLAGFPEAEGIRQSLDRAREGIGRIDWEPFSGDASRYPEIAKLLSTAGASAPLFRVRVFRSAAGACLSEPIAKEILRGAELLASIERFNDTIGEFTQAFLARYGDATVPLVDALDEEHGIGFAGSASRERRPDPTPAALGGLGGKLNAKEQLLLGKIEESWTSGSQVISLTSEELASIDAKDALPLPDSFAVRGALCASSEAALDAGEFSFRIDGVSGPPAWAALGPASSGDAQLRERLAGYLQEEESLQPGATFAEIVHFPCVGDPNLIVRPKLRAREIVYLGRSGANREDRIAMADLRLSVVAGRLRLSSQRLDRELIPRLTAPHDFSHPANPPIYRFLCALQNQGSAARVRWTWGALESAASLPRVVCGKLVLSRARWVLDAQAFEQGGRSNPAERFRALCRIRAGQQLPRFVEAGEGTSSSAFDLENVLSAESLIQKIRAERRLAICEMFPSAEALCAFGPQGRYIQELTVGFLRATGAQPPSALPLRSPR